MSQFESDADDLSEVASDLETASTTTSVSFSTIRRLKEEVRSWENIATSKANSLDQLFEVYVSLFQEYRSLKNEMEGSRRLIQKLKAKNKKLYKHYHRTNIRSKRLDDATPSSSSVGNSQKNR